MLRKLFAGTRHPVAYSNATLAVGMIAVMGIATAVSVDASERAGERASRAVIVQAQNEQVRVEAAKRAAREESDARTKATVCAVADRMVKVYDHPEVTAIGRDAGRAWEDLRALFQCDGK